MKGSFIIFIFLFLAGCASTIGTSTKTPDGKYSEDLSVLRKTEPVPADTSKGPVTSENANKRDPLKYVEARHSINKTLEAVLDSIDRINLANGVVEGFTIQLYSGMQRDEALNIRKQIATVLPGLDADMQFVQPNFRVRAGKYLNRLDAQKDYMTVKKHFPNAIIIPDRIFIR